MSTEPLRKPVYVNQKLSVSQGKERGVVIGERDYERIIERLDGCKPDGWANLWLFGAGAGTALSVGAAVGAMTVPITLSATKDVLWVLAVAGAVIIALCLVGYFTQRRELGREIGELRKDLEIRMPGTTRS